MNINVQYMGVDNLWSQTPLYNKSYFMIFFLPNATPLVGAEMSKKRQRCAK
jgi:hypothetical protein